MIDLKPKKLNYKKTSIVKFANLPDQNRIQDEGGFYYLESGGNTNLRLN